MAILPNGLYKWKFGPIITEGHWYIYSSIQINTVYYKLASIIYNKMFEKIVFGKVGFSFLIFLIIYH